ncbi:MAG: succinate dehydrogenase flavoprotein subunit, partial [Planctomycetota bacterium]|nr:succinate dehydrogenase flavoprotein subunit [Planctomycetota bacterium]
MAEDPVIVVGGGLAGLMTVIKTAEAGLKVALFSVCPVKRSHSVCAQGGINASVNTKGEGDSPYIHFVETIRGGDFLADQPPVKGMCDSAPALVYLLDRMGVMFNRTPEGLLDFRRFGGTLYSRTAFAGATTGQQLVYALDEQVRRYEAEGLVEKYEFWEFVRLVLDDSGRCRGIVAQNLHDMSFRAFPGTAVVLATGGPGLIFGRTTNSMYNTGFAAAVAYTQGAWYANGEFIQVHPTAIPGEDKLRLISESARGEGGRIWVPRKKGDDRPPNEIPESERWYFLEEKYPKYGNLVPRDIAARELYHVTVNLGLGPDGGRSVYLDLTHKDPAELDVKLGGILEIYEKFMLEDPKRTPMKVAPAVHYSMGGLWVGYEKDPATGALKRGSPKNHATNIPGLYAVGECDFQYHGANRLGANSHSLLSCLYGGQETGPAVVSYVHGLKDSASDAPARLFEAALEEERKDYAAIAAMSGTVNPFALHRELGETMNACMTIVRENPKLKETLARIAGFRERWRKLDTCDRSGRSNQAATFARALRGMLTLAEVMTKCALLRDECRGAHYKPEFEIPPPKDVRPDNPEWKEYFSRYFENNRKFLKTAVAEHTPDGPRIFYREVDTSLLEPEPRDYIGHASAAWKYWKPRLE